MILFYTKKACDVNLYEILYRVMFIHQKSFSIYRSTSAVALMQGASTQRAGAETTIRFLRADCSARGSDNSPVANVDQMNSHSQNSMCCFTRSTVSPIRQIKTLLRMNESKSPTSTINRRRPLRGCQTCPLVKNLSAPPENTCDLPTTRHHNRYLIFAVAVDTHARISPIDSNLIQ